MKHPTKPTQPEEHPPRKVFALVEVDDDGKEHRTFYETEIARDTATLSAIWFDGPDAEHAEEAEAYLVELREKGTLRFEGDAPLHWETYTHPQEHTALVRAARAEAFKEAALLCENEGPFALWERADSLSARAPGEPEKVGEENA